MSLLVANLGLPKSGTTTLARALKRAGYKVADHRIKDPRSDARDRDMVFVATMLYEGYFSTGDPGALMPWFTAISEMNMINAGKSLWPQMDFALLTALRKHHPDLKFVASRREAAALSKSMMAWNTLGKRRLPKSSIPGLPPGFGATSSEQERWIDGHYENLNHWFRGDDAYLELDVAAPDARDRLSAFLGRDLPWWGKANVNLAAEAEDSQESSAI